MSINNHNEQTRQRAEVLGLGSWDAQQLNRRQVKSEDHSMWQSLKGEYWSVRGWVVAMMVNATIAASILMFLGGYQVWTGEPFKGPQQQQQQQQQQVASRGK